MPALNQLASEPIRSRLLYEMTSGVYAECSRLPRESVLAQELGISRTQLRDSLSQLEREGFITRRHGVGTIINRPVLEIPVRMDIETEFLELVRASGFTPALAWTRAQSVPASPLVAERLQLPADSPVLRVARLITGDGRGAIFCYDYIDCGRIQDDSYTQDAFNLPIFSFLKQYCGLEPILDITQLSPCLATGEPAEALAVAEGQPLLYMDEVDYDLKGQPILYCQEYYAADIVKHMLIRKKF